MARRVFGLYLLLLPCIAPTATLADTATVTAPGRWLGPDGRPLPFVDDEEALEFLRRAKIIGWKELTSGSNRPSKVFLERNGVKASAIFRTVDIKLDRVRLEGRIMSDFHDSYIYECGAYEVARALGIDNVPPCVKRSVDLKQGTLQLWIEDAKMEKERREEGLEPPRPLHWIRQKQTMRLLDALIFNFDRNQTNILLDEGWKMWFVDHTRSFRRSPKIDDVEKIIWCERRLWERLQELDQPGLSRARRYVTGIQIKAVLKRRDLLVDHIQSLIDELGEAVVLYDAGVDEGAASLLERGLAVADEYPEASSTPLPPDG